ncbi:MAG: hypothetical protein M3065_01460, partial [Actinomycetota bacterium]|nr:hypothetical protein [Actinomycetota bacterium]
MTGIMSGSDAEIRPLFAPGGWYGALHVAGCVAHVFARAPRFWRAVEDCRGGHVRAPDGARHLVPLRQRSLWIVERYIEIAADRLDRPGWDLDLDGKQRMIGLELANLGINVLPIGQASPYPRKHHS